MSDSPPVGTGGFETYVRCSNYVAVSIPIGSLLGSSLYADRISAAPLPVLVTAGVLSLLLVAGNVLVTNWTIDTITGRTERVPPGGLVAWTLVLVAFVGVTLLVPFPAIGLTVAAALGSGAASLAPVLSGRLALLINAGGLALAVPLVGVEDVQMFLVGAVLITVSFWACWSNAWLLRVLLRLQAAQADRAALTLANERLRIARDLHDVFGRTLATIAVKSSLAAELARRGHDERAAAEITEVRRLAEEAGTEVRQVVRGEHRTTWDDEVSGARSLLTSAGIRCTVTGDPVPQERAEALAWVVREGVTNLLRHSAATQVRLATELQEGKVLLTVANDGAGPVATETEEADTDDGTGLRAMSERISALGGHLRTRREGDWFLLDAMLPLPEGNAA